jgi:hypothetical protein
MLEDGKQNSSRHANQCNLTETGSAALEVRRSTGGHNAGSKAHPRGVKLTTAIHGHHGQHAGFNSDKMPAQPRRHLGETEFNTASHQSQQLLHVPLVWRLKNTVNVRCRRLNAGQHVSRDGRGAGPSPAMVTLQHVGHIDNSPKQCGSQVHPTFRNKLARISELVSSTKVGTQDNHSIRLRLATPATTTMVTTGTRSCPSSADLGHQNAMSSNGDPHVVMINFLKQLTVAPSACQVLVTAVMHMSAFLICVQGD